MLTRQPDMSKQDMLVHTPVPVPLAPLRAYGHLSVRGRRQGNPQARCSLCDIVSAVRETCKADRGETRNDGRGERTDTGDKSPARTAAELGISPDVAQAQASLSWALPRHAEAVSSSADSPSITARRISYICFGVAGQRGHAPRIRPHPSRRVSTRCVHDEASALLHYDPMP